MKARLIQLVKSRFFRDTATLQIAGMLNQVCQLASTVVLAFLLGAEGQGHFLTAIALQGLLHFLINTGVVPATVSQIAASSARGLHDKVAGWIAFLTKTSLVFSLAVLSVGAFALPWYGRTFYPESPEVGMWAWWLCLEPVLDIPRIVAAAAFQGTRRMKALGQVENADEFVRFFLVVLGAALTGSAAGAVAGMLVASLFSSVLALELYKSARRDSGAPLPGVRQILARMREIPILQGMRLGIRVGLLKNGSSLFLNIFPRLIIGKIVGTEWVTYFHVAQRIVSVPMVFMLGISRTSLPALGELAGRRDWNGFRRLFGRITFLTGGVLSAAVLVGLLLVRPLVRALYPGDYEEPVFRYYWILSLGYIPFAFAVAIESFYIATNHVRTWLMLTVIGAIVTIPTNIWLIFAVPYTGAAYGLALYQSWVIVHLIYIFTVLYRGSAWGAPPSPGETAEARVLAETSVDISGRSSGLHE